MKKSFSIPLILFLGGIFLFKMHIRDKQDSFISLSDIPKLELAGSDHGAWCAPNYQICEIPPYAPMISWTCEDNWLPTSCVPNECSGTVQE